MKKIIIFFTIILSCLTLTGCSDSNNNNITTNNDTTITENQEKVKTYNVEDYPEIKRISNNFISELTKSPVNYTDITYEISQYYEDREYKTVNIYLNESEHITMKFSDDGKLLVLNFFGDLEEIDRSYYDDSILLMMQFSYYNFDKTEIINALDSTLKEKDYFIGDYKIERFPIESDLKIFNIVDTKNN